MPRPSTNALLWTYKIRFCIIQPLPIKRTCFYSNDLLELYLPIQLLSNCHHLNFLAILWDFEIFKLTNRELSYVSSQITTGEIAPTNIDHLSILVAILWIIDEVQFSYWIGSPSSVKSSIKRADIGLNAFSNLHSISNKGSIFDYTFWSFSKYARLLYRVAEPVKPIRNFDFGQITEINQFAGHSPGKYS